MRSDEKRRRLNRKTTVETLEERRVMSADPLGGLLCGSAPDEQVDDPLATPALELHASVGFSEQAPDFWLDTTNGSFEDQLYEIEQTLASAHGVTGLTQVRQNYGFLGTGQTVAVIDSGIAWDHYALGGGLGANYRVVGGWDFTENDADPYDDGPLGSHGTHVSGIVGGIAGNYAGDTGVAPGVDLVGLRVFNDTGAGYFSWVEDALEWVHLNRNSFESPITTVNLSLGTNWNANTVPSWGMLEDEFAQLEADGIFVAVSAGNSFATYNTPGLSYPAASSHVVPVMSVDDSGLLSYFSQRSSRSIAAPGRFIRSTMPDYAGNHNGRTDDWASMSGTSMASPYVAGASAIVREAMEFVGRTGITQQTIYDHMIATADRFFDAATNAYYNRLNLANAIDALIPDDDFGSSVVDAYNMGTIGAGASLVAGASSMEMDGLISKLDDKDFFTFTAGMTGTVSFTVSTTHQLSEVWDACDCASWGVDGRTLTLDVVAGRTYTVGMSSNSGLGYYDLTIDAEAAFTFTDWGAITQSRTNDLVNSGETWYRVEASRTGYLTIEALFASAGGNTDLALYDANLQLVTTGVNSTGSERVDVLADAGEEFYLRVTGSNGDVDFRLTNLVSVSGTTANVVGTESADTFAFAAGSSQHLVTVNGVAYQFAAGSVSRINCNGGAGSDRITMTGTAGNDVAVLRAGSATLSGSGYATSAAGVENVTVHSGGGNDTATFYDGATDDVFGAGRDFAVMHGKNFEYYNYAVSFNRVYAYATAGGLDMAYFYDSTLDDVFGAGSDFAMMHGKNFEYFNYTHGFDRAYAYSNSGGNDTAYLYDSAADDELVAGPDYTLLRGAGNEYYNYAQGFGRVYAYATAGGNDTAHLYDSAADDELTASSDYALLRGKGNEYNNYAYGFGHVYAYSLAGGNDTATFYDGATDDVFGAGRDFAVMHGKNFEYYNYAVSFNRVYAYATAGGLDMAYFYDSTLDDVFGAGSDFAMMHGKNFEYFNYTHGFDRAYAYSNSGGNDTAYLYDSAADDELVAGPDYTLLRGAGNEYYNYAQGFGRVYAYATAGGNDTAHLYDSAADDELTARDWGVELLFEGEGSVLASGFDAVTAYSIHGGEDEDDVEALDYVFDEVGNWS